MNSEEGIRAHADAAQQHGATLHCSEKVQRWRVLPSGEVAVTTEKATYTASKLVLAAGAWMPEMVPELQAGFSSADSPHAFKSKSWHRQQSPTLTSGFQHMHS